MSTSSPRGTSPCPGTVRSTVGPSCSRWQKRATTGRAPTRWVWKRGGATMPGSSLVRDMHRCSEEDRKPHASGGAKLNQGGAEREFLHAVVADPLAEDRYLVLA